MVTRTYGHKATFRLDQNQPTNGTTLQCIHRQIEEIGEGWTNPRVTRDWSDWIKERIRHDQLIRNEIAKRIILADRELHEPSPLTAANLSHLPMKQFTSPRRGSTSNSGVMPSDLEVEGTDQTTTIPGSI